MTVLLATPKSNTQFNMAFFTDYHGIYFFIDISHLKLLEALFRLSTPL